MRTIVGWTSEFRSATNTFETLESCQSIYTRRVHWRYLTLGSISKCVKVIQTRCFSVLVHTTKNIRAS